MTAFFASCPKYIELLLVKELTALGATEVHEKRAGVAFVGDTEVVYRALLTSRLANHIFQPIAEFSADEWPKFYQGLVAIDWPSYFSVEKEFVIDVDCIRTSLNHQHYASQLAKDALVDCFRDRVGQRPNVNVDQPQVVVHCLIKEQTVTVSLNLSGSSLHRRGYRQGHGEAPLKENLAAAILYRANWPQLAQAQYPLVDPMCGSGTFLIEAALMAANIAPGLLRRDFAVKHLRQFDAALWQRLLIEAAQTRALGLRELPKIIGFDSDAHMVRQALANIEQAGLTRYVHVERRELTHCTAPAHSPHGLLIVNPPYGERLGEVATLAFTYQHLGEVAKQQFAGWQLSVLSGNRTLSRYLRLAPDKVYQFYNGSLACELLNCQIRGSVAPIERVSEPVQTVALSADAQAFKNKLVKNLKHVQKWAKREHVNSYRVYDADLPQYAVAIDVYDQQYVYVQEYAPPKSIDPIKAQQRLLEVVQVMPEVFAVPAKHVFVKTRQKQKGKQQYQKMAEQHQFWPIHEGSAQYLVNFSDYLDTGVFLDTRLVRRFIHQHIKGKTFLNCFAYTGTATVQAALGGASRTVSVDLSNTYIAWAKRNLALNGFSFKYHDFIQADCFHWLDTTREKFDVVLVDPPSFSNSKKTETVLDIERDHVELLHLAMRHVNKHGLCLFVTNKQRFQLDQEALSQYAIQDITTKTLPEDFKRYGLMHQAFELRHVHDKSNGVGVE